MNGFNMNGRDPSMSLSMRELSPDINTTGAPQSIGLGDQIGIEPARKRAIEQHQLDIAVPQLRQGLDRCPNQGCSIGWSRAAAMTSETRGSSSTTRMWTFSIMI